ncbi:MAG: isoprenylcysteine carboxylmethyltransferase family protein [Flavobacteriales bacterium]|nr:isoprenylcysteine carboxylmethyltransferase family protein [Flavobacteriales bacterium]MCB9197762.1 isoprenylcysteine carboxylmethyltransferase family protein [Flavobacteriales bacterium]
MNLVTFTIILVLYFTFHSVLASNNVKRFLQSYIPSKSYRLLFTLQSTAFLGILFFYYLQLSNTIIFESPRNLGLIILIVGSFLLLVAARQYHFGEFIGTYQFFHNGNSPAHGLSKKGLNRLIRHPLYTATIILLIGLLFYQPYLKSAVLAIVSLLYIFIGTKLEETKLTQQFGEEYINYKKQVGMFLPKIKFKR